MCLCELILNTWRENQHLCSRVSIRFGGSCHTEGQGERGRESFRRRGGGFETKRRQGHLIFVSSIYAKTGACLQRAYKLQVFFTYDTIATAALILNVRFHRPDYFSSYF